jgi:ABC-type oligopeptide transport system substrate-binding subunit
LSPRLRANHPRQAGRLRPVRTFDTIDAGDHVIFRRNPDYWAKDLPQARGQYNYDTIRYDFYRDMQGAFEAFKKGEALLRTETDASRWAVGYADLEGQPVTLEQVEVGLPNPAWSLVFNTRRPIFADKRVREALIHTFDFQVDQRTVVPLENGAHTGLFLRLQPERHWQPGNR